MEDSLPGRQSITSVGSSRISAAAIAALLGCFLVAFHTRIIDSDFFWHLKAGDIIAASGKIPQSDPFSGNAVGHEWTTHEWLWDWVMHYAFAGTGWWGIGLLKLACFAVALGLQIAVARKRGAAAGAILCATLVAMIPLMAFSDQRPQLWSFALFSAVALVLELAPRSPRLLWVLPGLFAFWANVHAAFIIALPLLAAKGGDWWLAGRRPVAGAPDASKALHLLPWAVGASLLAALLNPNGWNIYLFPLKVVAVDVFKTGITEWAAPTLHRPFWPLYATFILTTVSIVIARRALRLADVALVGLMMAATLNARRQMVFFALVALPVLSVSFSDMWTRFVEPRPRLFAKMRVAVLALAVAFFAFGWTCYIGTRGTWGVGPQPGRFPERAADLLSREPEGGVILNDYNDGGYLIFRLWPKWKVTMDGRADVYGPELAKDYMAAWSGGSAVSQVLQNWNVVAILGRYDLPPAVGLWRWTAKVAADEWSPVFFDDTSILYLKDRRMTTSGRFTPFRRLHPGLPPSDLAKLQTSADDWAMLGADIRRAVNENPESLMPKRWLKWYDSQKK